MLGIAFITAIAHRLVIAKGNARERTRVDLAWGVVFVLVCTMGFLLQIEGKVGSTHLWRARNALPKNGLGR